jgi:hypothetical protein
MSHKLTLLADNYSSFPSVPILSGLVDLMHSSVKKVKRRGLNKSERLGPLLRFIDATIIDFHPTIFVLQTDDLVARLTQAGFKIENNIRFRHSANTMYWEEFNIELELVDALNWDILRRCINVSHATSSYLLNPICDAIQFEGLYATKKFEGQYSKKKK